MLPPREQLRFTVRFTNRLALWSPSAFVGVWPSLWEHLHASKLIFGPCIQLLPLQSIKLKERPAIQFWDQMHSNIGSRKLPCASSLCSHETARPRDCKSARGLCVNWALPILSYSLPLPALTCHYLYMIFGKIDAVGRFFSYS